MLEGEFFLFLWFFGRFSVHSVVEILKGVALSGVQVCGDLDLDSDPLVAALLAAQTGCALAAQTELGAGLGTGGEFILDFSADGRDFEFCAEGGLSEGHVLAEVDIGAVAFEEVVGPDGDKDDEVAGGAAMFSLIAGAADGHSLSVVDTGGNFDGDFFPFVDHAFSAAGAAGLIDELTGAAAAGASLLSCHNAEGGPALHVDDAGAAAIGASFWLGAVGAAGTVTVGAIFESFHVDLFFAAIDCVHKVDCKVSADTVALLWGVCVTGLTGETAAEAAAKAAAEDCGEDIAHIEAIEAGAAGACAVIRIDAGEAELIVAGFFLFIGEDLVSLVDFFEHIFGCFIAWIHIWVIFFCQFAVSALDFVLGGAAVHAEDFIIVAFFVCHNTVLSSIGM